ncbi:hypothetical protein EDB84DRAFT_1447605 [Lactarius hengduanensis]|nr:hypothetical protein EDB84DRAFT_1447605 [Lactarius hengduanensis]
MACDTPPLPPQHGTQHPDHQPTTMLPQYGTQHPATADLPCCLNTTRNTPPTRHAASTLHARPSHHRPPRHPNTARNTPPPADSPPPRPNTARQDPAMSRHVAQDPADTPRRLNTPRKAATTNPHDMVHTTMPPVDSPPPRPNTARQDPAMSPQCSPQQPRR